MRCMIRIGMALLFSIIPIYNSSASSELMRTLNVTAEGPYEVWAGNKPCPDISIDDGNGNIISVPGYYDAPRFGYVLLGQADAPASFTGNYKYYVVATRSLFHLDAIQKVDGVFIEEESHDPLVGWGNVHLPWQFDENGNLIGNIMDYSHDE